MIKKTKFRKLGMRNIKTTIAIFLAIFFSNVLNLESPLQATLTAFFCLQGSIVESSKTAKNRSYGTIIGGILAFLFLMFMPNNMYMIPIGVMALIYLCNSFDKSEIIGVAGALFLVMSFDVSALESFNVVNYVIDRTVSTFIGIAIAMTINYYIKPPNPFDKLQVLNLELTEFISYNIDEQGDFDISLDLEKYRLKMHEFKALIEFYHQEVSNYRYKLDINYYANNLVLFRVIYSHIFIILNSVNGELSRDIKKYHVKDLAMIRKEIVKRI